MSEYNTDFPNKQQLPENNLIPGTSEYPYDPNKSDLMKSVHIYYLVDNQNEIIYVGQTRDIQSRIKAHSKDKKFEKVLYRTVYEEFADDEEFEAVMTYLPRLNKTIPNSRLWTSFQEICSIYPFVHNDKVTFLRKCRQMDIQSLNGYYLAPQYTRVIAEMKKEGRCE